MNLRTTIVLLVLVLALGLGWALFLRPDTAAVPAGPLFAGLDAAPITRVVIEDPSGQRTGKRLVLGGGPAGWSVEAATLDGGRPVRARSDVVAGMLEALRALVPLAVLENGADAAAFARYGLDPGHAVLVTIERDGKPPLVGRFGAPQGTRRTAFSGSGSTAVVAVATEAFHAAIPTLEQLEDTSLLPVQVTDIRALRFRFQDGTVKRLERRFDRWWQTEPSEQLADDKKADLLRSLVVDARVLRRIPEASAVGLIEEPLPVRIEIEVSGREKPVEVEVGRSIGKEGVPVRIVGDPTLKIVPEAFVEALATARSSLRDPRLFPFPRSEVSAVRWMAGERTVLDLRRENGEWFVVRPTTLPAGILARPTDRIEIGTFLDRLLAVQFSDFSADGPAVVAGTRLEVDRSDGLSAQRITTSVEFGGDGELLFARILGESGSGRVARNAVEFLDQPWWSLLARFQNATDAYFRIAKIEISDASGKKLLVRCRIDKPQDDLRGRVAGVTPERDLPDSMLREVSRRIVDFGVKGYAAEARTPEMGLEAPTMLVRFFEAEDATMNGIPAEPKGRWREIRFGSRRGDGTWHAVMDDPLGLVLIVDDQDLNPFRTLLREFGQ